MRVSNVLFLVASAPLALAVPLISSPAAGAPIPAGPITIKWADDNKVPLLAALGSCTIQLMAGSNTVNQPIMAVPGVVPASAGTASLTVAAAVSGNAPNA
jgi:hypothetical protein